jgi:5-methylcytosine-specific restriction endonuclease McrA
MAYEDLSAPDYLKYQRRLRSEYEAGRPLNIPMSPDERGSLLILGRIDANIDRVDQARINRRLEVHRTNARNKAKRPPPLYSRPELYAIRVLRQMVLIRKSLICRSCGNNRLSNPDIEGKCQVCLRKRKKASRERWKARLRSGGTWKAYARISRLRRRAREKGAPVNDLTASGLAWVKELYGTNCLICGAPDAVMDHIVPLARGGNHSADNLQPLCVVCNSRKCANNQVDYRPFPYRSPCFT